ncbi:MFS transporter [Nocardia macrotermitis]|uniref:Putative MFS-type transporter n=1 Tax=Nocardia macrotermitis TaxID=2585198 RepID=A0A7K0CY52_9NOCA|nr:MFS transporter [Nocardia macrotermitis]MQY18430.1 putative MFS-type transporter [Nocardia macrotermitis]
MVAVTQLSTTRRWVMLALGVFAQAASAVMSNGAPFLLPALTERGMPLATAGLLVAMPMVGMVCTLIAWGYAVDRFGERTVLIVGPLLMFGAGVAAAATTNYLVLGGLLLLAGIGAASTNGASGRVIAGWFPPDQRGLAMGIRQTAQPIGVGIAALAIPAIAAAQGFSTAILVPALMAAAAVIGCAIGIIDPPRPERTATQVNSDNPYRSDTTLWRIHAVSVLLVIPQATVWTFALLWLNHAVGLALAAAGVLVTVTQILGAAGRIGAGIWSDRLGSRLRPLRTIAIAAVISMAALGFSAWLHWWWAALPILVIASVITVADNGLSFTAVAEIAGPFWSGRGLGIQNTGQYLATATVAPVFGALITAWGFPAAYLAAATCAIAAVPLVPRDRRRP